MKKQKKIMMTLLLLILGILSSITSVHAKTWMVELKANKTYTTDVNGDGKKDKFKYVEKTVQSDYPQQTHRIFYINGKKVKDVQSYGTSRIYLYKSSTANEYLIIGSHWKGGSTDYEVFHCRKALKSIGHLPANHFVDKLSLSGSNIQFVTYGKFTYVTKYRPAVKLSGGKIILTSKYPKITGRKSVIAPTSFRTYKSVNSTKKDGFMIYKGQKINILKVYLKKNYNSYTRQYYYTTFYQISVNGKKAWISSLS